VVTRQRPRSTRLLVVALVAISLGVITVDYREGEDGPLAGIGRTLLSTMAPLQQAVTEVTRPIGDFFIGLAHLPSLERDNQSLMDERNALRSELQRQQQVRHNYEVLVGLVGLKESLDPEAVVARVVANGVGNFDWTVTIGSGSADGVEVDMPVVAGSSNGAQLVGRVTEVSQNAAIVELIIDRNAAAAAYLASSRTTGLVRGQGEDDLIMEQVEPNTPVQADEAVFTKGYQVNGQPGIYPPDILIGTVSRAFTSDDDIQELVTVRPAVDFSTLDFVLVLRSAGARG
jgi:rod shape-determining protein MreC